MGWLSTIAAIGMAIGPPLAYGDQYIAIVRSHKSEGFSIDVCGILIVANTTRVFFWLGDHFQLALLIQSFLMILAQFALLYVCLLYRPKTGGVVDPRSTQEVESLTSSGVKPETISKRPGALWQWKSFGSYLEFIALLILVHCSVFLLLHPFNWYVTTLGFIALGLEATLPIPQFIVNFERKSTAGFRRSVLAGWLAGDAFKTVYFFLTPDNAVSFKACAIFQLSVDIALVAQTYLYREQTALDLQNRIGLNEGGVAGLSGAVDAARLHRHEAREHQLEEEEDANEDEEERVGSVGGGGNVSVGAAGARRYDR